VALVPAIAAASGAELVAVAARDKDRAGALVPTGRAYARYDDLVADPDVDIVYCALPNQAHLPWTLAALDQGKHVLCEKPLALDAVEVDTVSAAARQAGRLVVEASWYRWHPRTLRAEGLTSSGEVGRVRHVEAGFTFSGIPVDDYRMDPRMGGGSLYDVGCYALSAVGWATGWAVLDVGEVRTRMSSGGVDMCIEAELKARSGPPVSARIRAAFDEPEKQWLHIEGESGAIRFGSPAFSAWSTDATSIEIEGAGRGVRVETFEPCNPYQLMVEAVSQAIRGQDTWVVPLAQSRAVAAAIDSIRLRQRPAGQP